MSRMMVIKCDRCGCEIKGDHTYRIMPYVADLSGEVRKVQPYEAEMERDYCDDCLTDIMDYMHKQKAGNKSKGKNGAAVRCRLDVGKVISLKKAGWSNAKIADEMGVNASTIVQCLKRNEVETQ